MTEPPQEESRIRALPLPELPPRALGRLEAYAGLLIEANARARLVGPSDPAVLMADHIRDCCAALPLLPSPGGHVADVGTGGGLPGLVWAICRPDLAFLLLDSVGKKIDRVAEIVARLGLTNVRTLRARAEEAGRTERERFGLVAARAVTEAGCMAELLAPLARVGGTLLTFKGRRVFEELDRVRIPWSRLGLGTPELLRYELPPAPGAEGAPDARPRGEAPTEGEEDARTRYLLAWRKAAPCPSRYPRAIGEAERRPWYGAERASARGGPTGARTGAGAPRSAPRRSGS
jgi:16S rRNA (guanine527-N7)-methyltransferase